MRPQSAAKFVVFTPFFEEDQDHGADIYHAAYGGSQRRRMFTMNCTRRAKNPEDMALAHKYLSIHSAGGNNFDTGAGMFFPTMIDTANENRMLHLAQPIAIHDELFPHLARRQ